MRNPFFPSVGLSSGLLLGPLLVFEERENLGFLLGDGFLGDDLRADLLLLGFSNEKFVRHVRVDKVDVSLSGLGSRGSLVCTLCVFFNVEEIAVLQPEK